MLEFTTKSGAATVYAEKSRKENAINVGVDSKLGSGFVSVPAGKRELVHAASAIGAVLLMGGLTRRQGSVKRAQEAARKQEAFARKTVRQRKGTGFAKLNLKGKRKRR